MWQRVPVAKILVRFPGGAKCISLVATELAYKSNVAEGSLGVNEFWTKRGIFSHRGANYAVDYTIEKDADPIKCEIVMQLGMEVL